MKHTITMRKITVGFLLSISLSVFAGAVSAQGKQAILLMRSGNTAAACEGTAEMNYRTVFELKLNNKDEIRMLTGAVSAGSSPDTMIVPRNVYEDAVKNKLTNAFELRWQNNF